MTNERSDGARRLAAFGLFIAAALIATAVPAQQVRQLRLIDARTGEVINEIGNGSTINLNQFPSVDVRADVRGGARSVVFSIDGQRVGTDNTGPFFLSDAQGGGSAGSVTLPMGDVRIDATAYEGRNGTGANGGTFSTLVTVTGGTGGEGGPASDFAIEGEAETEAETEVEVQTADGIAGASIANAASAAASGNNAIAHTETSGSLSIDVDRGALANEQEAPDGAVQVNALSGDSNGQSLAMPVTAAEVTILSAEAEAETEIEAEAEAAIGRGSAVAAAGVSAAAAGVGTQIYLLGSGDIEPAATETRTDIETATSTSSSTSPNDTLVNGGGTNGEEAPEPPFGEGGISGDVRAAEDPSPVDIPAGAELQLETEVEVESESEAEVEAETGPGAAAAAAAGGSVASSVGDFAAVDTKTSIATSASSSRVTEDRPLDRKPESETGNLVPAEDEPVARGLFEAEAEAEAEAETEVEAGNNSAAVATVGSGNGGSAALAATARVSASTVAATSTSDESGAMNRANDRVVRSFERFAQSVEFGDADAEAEAEAMADPAIELSPDLINVGPEFSRTSTSGDAEARAEDTLSGWGTAFGGEVSQGLRRLPAREAPADPPAGDRSDGDATSGGTAGNLEIEVESETEVEIEAEISFNAAAAGAAAVAAQAENGYLPTPAEAMTATSASTGVYGVQESQVDDRHTPGPAPEGQRGRTGRPDLDLSVVTFEVEVESEAEAEVGFGAAGAGGAAAAGGQPGIQSLVEVRTTPYAAASAAGSGLEVELVIEMPEAGEAGDVVAIARAEDPNCRGVSVAVAVAGVPTVAGLDNEAKRESEQLCNAVVRAVVQTDPADAEARLELDLDAVEGAIGGNDGEPEAFDSTFESEVEAEAEANVEVGFGVAAAASGAGAAGIYGVADAKTSTSTLAGFERGQEEPCAADLPLTADAWFAVSIPCDLDGATYAEAIGDDLGVDGYREEWIIFTYDAGAMRYDTPDLDEAVVPGRGFWLQTREESRTLRVSGDALDTVTVDLEPGWNLVGNPFGSPYAWGSSEVVTADGTTLTIEQADPGGDAVGNTACTDDLDTPNGGGGADECVVARFAYAWNPGADVYDELNTTFGTLEEMQGFWVFADEASALRFPAGTSSASAR